MVVEVQSKLMGLTRFQNLIILAVLCLITVGCEIASIFLPYRTSIGSSFMYPAKSGRGFPTRKYGLFYVQGARIQSWATLANSACDRYDLYSSTDSLFDSAPVCSDSSDPETCSHDFLTHLESRCVVYNYLAITSFVSQIVLGAALLLSLWVLVTLSIASLAEWRRYLIAGQCVATVCAIATPIVWLILSGIWFRRLAETATDPFPKIGLGMIFGLVGSGASAFVALYLVLLGGIVTRESEKNIGRGGIAEFAKRMASGEVVDEARSDTA